MPYPRAIGNRIGESLYMSDNLGTNAVTADDGEPDAAFSHAKTLPGPF